MDQQAQIKEFLASRRARISPQQAGVPTFNGTRRVPGLRREEVAHLAGVSVDYYTRIERGKVDGASLDVLEPSPARCNLTMWNETTCWTWSR
jgi:transcriptional regulator with XRE-family HTH domain